MTAFNAFADDTIYTSQDGLWKYRILDDGTAEIYNDDDIAYCGSEQNVVIPDTIDGHTVVGLGDYSFNYLSDLQSITIPSSLNTIGNVVFGGCTGMKSIIVSPDNTSFLSVDGVLFNKSKTTLIYYPTGRENSTYIIPDDVLTIEGFAFIMCSSLENIVIPEGLSTLGIEAFALCTSLNEITLPSTITEIPYLAFYGCTSLETVDISDTCSEIGMGAFAYCSSLSSFSIPSNVTEIPDMAFCGCTSLTEITIGSWVLSINDSAFSDSALTTIKGYYDTAAEIFANDNGYTFVSLDVITPGDFNADESVTLSDYSDYVSYLEGNITSLSKVQTLCSDIDGDGAIDAFDLYYLDKILNNLA